MRNSTKAGTLKVTRFRDINLWFCMGITLLMRIIWTLRYPVAFGSDSNSYLYYAKEAASGHITGFLEYPLHQLYPILLAPSFIFGIQINTYVFLLHTLISILTTICVYMLGKRLGSALYGTLAAFLYAVYPSTLFWFSYILTETQFLFFLSVFLLCFSYCFPRGGFRELTLLTVSSIFVFFSRPVSLPILMICWGIVFIYKYNSSLNWKKLCAFSLKLGTALILFIVSCLVTIPTLRYKLFSLPTFSQSLWLSTKLTTNSLQETNQVFAEDDQLKLNYTAKPQNLPFTAYKAELAIQFIYQHPIQYLGMALKRFTAFWYPWVFADNWSVFHRILDAFLSIFLTVFSFLTIKIMKFQRLEKFSLFLIAISLGILCSFSQIDTDARYRFPAEFILLLLAPEVLIFAFSKGKSQFKLGSINTHPERSALLE